MVGISYPIELHKFQHVQVVSLGNIEQGVTRLHEVVDRFHKCRCGHWWNRARSCRFGWWRGIIRITAGK